MIDFIIAAAAVAVVAWVIIKHVKLHRMCGSLDNCKFACENCTTCHWKKKCK